MPERKIEVLVGCFMLAAIAALLVLALKVSGLSNYVAGTSYQLTANFDNIGDLKPRAPVTIGGVRIGQVGSINLDTTTFKAVVTMHINSNQRSIPQDSSASIFTEGLLGSNYISITPGYEQAVLKEGDKIAVTHPAIILENLIGQLLFSVGKKK